MQQATTSSPNRRQPTSKRRRLAQERLTCLRQIRKYEEHAQLHPENAGLFRAASDVARRRIFSIGEELLRLQQAA